MNGWALVAACNPLLPTSLLSWLWQIFSPLFQRGDALIVIYCILGIVPLSFIPGNTRFSSQCLGDNKLQLWVVVACRVPSVTHILLVLFLRQCCCFLGLAAAGTSATNLNSLPKMPPGGFQPYSNISFLKIISGDTWFMMISKENAFSFSFFFFSWTCKVLWHYLTPHRKN